VHIGNQAYITYGGLSKAAPVGVGWAQIAIGPCLGKIPRRLSSIAYVIAEK
jgi:hypothetical protein